MFMDMFSSITEDLLRVSVLQLNESIDEFISLVGEEVVHLVDFLQEGVDPGDGHFFGFEDGRVFQVGDHVFELPFFQSWDKFFHFL
jgi:hypothetical protein